MNETLDRDGTCAHIRKLCAERRVSVDRIAEHMNVSRQTVYAWFSSKKMPTIDHLIELSDLLGVTVDELLVRKKFFSGT